jgi:hypothetical protein
MTFKRKALLNKTNMKTSIFLLIQTAWLLAISCSPSRPEIVIDVNEPIHHDDFEYSVTQCLVRQKIGEDADGLIANGDFYVITFRVTNNAKRINHQWDRSIAYVIDEKGTIYENQKKAQVLFDRLQSMARKESYLTPAQSQDSTHLIFELPSDIKTPYLMVRGETLMGDFFDGGKFKRTKIKLFE